MAKIKVYEQILGNPLAGYLGKFKLTLDVDTVILVDSGYMYKILHKSADNKTVIVAEVDFNINAVKTDWNDWIECPICQCYDFNTFTNDWVFDTLCPDCGAVFYVSKNAIGRFRTEVIKKPKLQVLSKDNNKRR